jgi:hypothetical protein
MIYSLVPKHKKKLLNKLMYAVQIFNQKDSIFFDQLSSIFWDKEVPQKNTLMMKRR